jgi:hypothetical protein
VETAKRFAGLRLAKKDRAELSTLKSKGKQMSARTWRRVRVLELLDEGLGRARWTVRLVTEQVVARGIAGRVGRETIRIVLATHELKPWREKNVVRASDRPGVRPPNGGRAPRLRTTS